ncbi:fungal-specific transcription factor domain-containing protein [Lasiosphaeria miniovina]|uniref:Fungal-specific transcription factor domain-containing protein n=1 Tax=Lasiosphaeria miniovina TaxID=1954250 RepID=A0AA40ABK8_9PEZI|nr:fungal-specific transcription factor domain-containing protein [Lasiosphaeria miniovina]KAK0712846.1 fungal-specific transcription factor domain-containing protein [Lasiosphaeria miniovina]
MCPAPRHALRFPNKQIHRPISKAYMSSLASRIVLLEGMLHERGVNPPPATHPPKTRQEAQTKPRQDQPKGQRRSFSQGSDENPPYSLDGEASTPIPSGDEDAAKIEAEAADSLSASLPWNIDPVLSRTELKKDGHLRRLLCSEGTMAVDQSSGRLRFFGPTANSHVYAESAFLHDSSAVHEQARRADRIIRSLGPSTRDHLMTCFWSHYNSVTKVIDQAVFEADRDVQNPSFYSPFLHITMLAAGYRFADRDREDVKRNALRNWESTFHREAKCMLDAELERPGAIPSVQALLILADLECGVGRDSTGWMYSGMANRLAFDIGLHVSCGQAGVSETGKRVRRQVMMACLFVDRRWALLLGRPTSIKFQDISLDLRPTSYSALSPETFTMQLSDPGPTASESIENAIHQHLLGLMELAGMIADAQNTTRNITNRSALNAPNDSSYRHVIMLDRHLQNWYRGLPESLVWSPANIKSAPFSFFILHQQYHVCVILLHRPWAKYGPTAFDSMGTGLYASTASPASGSFVPGLDRPRPIGDDNRASLSRSMCTQHGVRVARIFWQHRQRFNGRKICIGAIQHAGTAALALMAALAHQSAELDHHSNLRYLQVISTAIYDMSHTYQPAARMYHLLKHMLVDIRKDMANSGVMLGRLQQQKSSFMFDAGHWSPSNEGIYSGSNVRSNGGDVSGVEAAKKRRRLSSRSTPAVARPIPSTYPYAVGPRALDKSSNTSSKSIPQAEPYFEVSEAPQDFDLDFFHAEFANLINEKQDKTAGASVADDCITADPPLTANPADLESTSSLNRRADSESTPDVTIEEWLTEPPALTPASSARHSPGPARPADSLAAASTDFGDPQKHQQQQQQHLGDGAGNSISRLIVDLTSDCGFDFVDAADSLGDSNQMILDGDDDDGTGGTTTTASALEWMIKSADPMAMMDTITPMTLDDLIQNAQKAAGAKRDRHAVPGPPPRNHELDYLRL